MKTVVSSQNELLDHPDEFVSTSSITIRITSELMDRCSIGHLNPTGGLICVRVSPPLHRQKHGARFTKGVEVFQIPAEVWERTKELFPAATPIPATQAECVFCLDGREPMTESTVNETPAPITSETPALSETPAPNETPAPIANETPAAGMAVSPEATVRVKQEPAESLSFLERQARRTEYLQSHLSAEAANGDGFMPLTYSTETPSSLSSLSTVSPGVGSPLQGGLGVQENPLQGHFIPLGAPLFLALENNQINPDDYFIKDIQPAQRRQLLLQNRLLASLIHRQHVWVPAGGFSTRLSKAYFTKRPQITDGCYFLVSASWLMAWRQWLLRDATTDTSGQLCNHEYQNLAVVKYPRVCPHSYTVIPGYMDHFIRGYSSIPCTVREGSSNHQ